MDTLDIAIFRELLQPDIALPVSSDPLRSLRSIAKRLGVDKDTVRKRLNALRKRGFLSEPSVFPNPGLLGLEVGQYWADIGPGSKADAISRLRSEEAVVLVTDHLADSLIFLTFREPEKRDVERRRFESGIPGLLRLTSARIRFPKATVEASAQDWRILKILQQKPGVSLRTLSEMAGYSTRTVERRLKRLIGGRAVFVIPRFDPRAVDGTLVDYTVFYRTGASKEETDRRVMKSVGEMLFHADLGEPTHSSFNFVLRNVADGMNRLAWVGESAGVESSRMDLVVERIHLTDHMERLLARDAR